MRAQGVAGAHRHGGFFHENQRFEAMADHGVTHRQDVLEVGRTVLVRGRADGDKQYLAVLDGQFLIAGEVQAATFQVALDHGLQPWFEDRNMALAQQVDLVLVNVHAHDIVTDFGQDSRLYQAYITATNYADFHTESLGRGIRGELIVRTPRMTSATPSVLERLKLSWKNGRLAASR